MVVCDSSSGLGGLQAVATYPWKLEWGLVEHCDRRSCTDTLDVWKGPNPRDSSGEQLPEAFRCPVWAVYRYYISAGLLVAGVSLGVVWGGGRPGGWKGRRTACCS